MDARQEADVLSVLPNITRLANKAASMYGCDAEDALQDGMLGVISALDRYDPEHDAGKTFVQFAMYRAWGSMLDEYRRRTKYIRSEKRPPPTPIPIDILTKDNPKAELSSIEDVCANVVDIVDCQRAVSSLPARMQYIIMRRYFDNQDLRVIGNELGITESRCSQIINEALYRMRTQYWQAS